MSTTPSRLADDPHRVRMVFEKTAMAVRTGTVNEQERTLLLTNYYGTTVLEEAIARAESKRAEPAIDAGIYPQPPKSTPPQLTIRDLMPQAANDATQCDPPRPPIAQSTTLDDTFDDTPKNIYTWRIIAVVALFAIIITGLFATLFWSTGGITGAAVYEQRIDRTLIDGDVVTFNLTNTTKLTVIGSITGVGDADIVLRTTDGERTLYAWRHGAVRTTHASLAKSWYTVGETVAYTPDTASPGSIVSAYLMTDGQATPLDGTTIEGLTAGEYTITLIIDETATAQLETAPPETALNGTNETGNTTTTGGTTVPAAEPILTQERLSFTVVETGASAPSATFSTCGDACSLPGIDGVASIDVIAEVGVTVTLERLVQTSGNEAPQLENAIPDVTGERAVVIDLSAAFTDLDGDTLTFDVGPQEGYVTEIAGSTLTIQSDIAGTATFVAYASDGQEVVPSNVFSVTITQSAAVEAIANGTNETNTTESTPVDLNGTTNETNSTVTPPATPPVTTNGTNETNSTDTAIGISDPCLDPDPNKRQTSCLQGDESTWFKPETIIIEDKTAHAVGQLTPIGNLLIRGDLVAGSTAAPVSTDYQLGYRDEDGDFVPTLWVDSQTGDLHLRGQLTEANGNIVYQDGLSAFTNQRSIILALVNPRTGDLTLRGNLVPYRRTFG